MPRKLAIFCEGQSEFIFLSSLLSEYAGASSFSIQSQRFSGGKGSSHRRRELLYESKAPDSDRFILLVDSGMDSRVLSDMLEQGAGLLRNGYWGLLGVRDLAPRNTIANMHTARLTATSTLYRFNADGMRSSLLIAVQEIETWFLAEHTHFCRIDSRLNLPIVNSILGYDCSAGDLRGVMNPNRELNKVYRHAHKGYSKKGKTVQKTVYALCYCQICFDVSLRIREIQSLLTILDFFFKP